MQYVVDCLWRCFLLSFFNFFFFGGWGGGLLWVFFCCRFCFGGVVFLVDCLIG